jgi:two-component system nitrogen regulation response regulator GlnG
MAINSKVTINDLPEELLNKKININANNDWGKILESWILEKYNTNSKNISKDIDSIYESILIKSAMELANGKKTDAAKILGWGRNTITNKMKNY